MKSKRPKLKKNPIKITSADLNKMLEQYQGELTHLGYKGKPFSKAARRLIRKSKDEVRKKRKQEKRDQFQLFAEKLENQLPRSEAWFRSLYEKHYKIDSDKYNQIFHMRYIPDLINDTYKYIIEVDGSIHDLERVSKNDREKDYFYEINGYKVFRLKAYDIFEYIRLIQWLFDIRGHLSLPTTAFKQFVASSGLEYDRIINNS